MNSSRTLPSPASPCAGAALAAPLVLLPLRSTRPSSRPPPATGCALRPLARRRSKRRTRASSFFSLLVGPRRSLGGGGARARPLPGGTGCCCCGGGVEEAPGASAAGDARELDSLADESSSAAAAAELATPVDVPLLLLPPLLLRVLRRLPLVGDARRLRVRGPARSLSLASSSASSASWSGSEVVGGATDDDDEMERGEYERGCDSASERSRRCLGGRVVESVGAGRGGGDEAEDEEGGEDGEADESDGGKTGIAGWGGMGWALPSSAVADERARASALRIAGSGWSLGGEPRGVRRGCGATVSCDSSILVSSSSSTARSSSSSSSTTSRAGAPSFSCASAPAASPLTAGELTRPCEREKPD